MSWQFAPLRHGEGIGWTVIAHYEWLIVAFYLNALRGQKPWQQTTIT